MSKITKKEQIENLQAVVAAQWRQINKLKLHLGRLVDIDWSDEQADSDEVIAILDSKQSKLKTLDQSVFDGLDEKWRFAAVDANSKAFVFSLEPTARSYEWYAESIFDHKEIGEGYDTSNWKESLIERDIAKELTGGDLCRAMLERGDKVVLCAVSDDGDFVDGDYDAIRGVDEDGLFESHCSFWWYVQPVSNQGEPLTAADVGL